MLPSAPVPRRPPRPWRGPQHRLLPGQGWSLLCNGVIVFDDTGKLLPDGRAIPRTGRSIPLGPPLNTASLVTTMPRRRAIAFRPPLTLISLGQAPGSCGLQKSRRRSRSVLPGTGAGDGAAGGMVGGEPGAVFDAVLVAAAGR